MNKPAEIISLSSSPPELEAVSHIGRLEVRDGLIKLDAESWVGTQVKSFGRSLAHPSLSLSMIVVGSFFVLIGIVAIFSESDFGTGIPTLLIGAISVFGGRELRSYHRVWISLGVIDRTVFASKVLDDVEKVHNVMVLLFPLQVNKE